MTSRYSVTNRRAIGRAGLWLCGALGHKYFVGPITHKHRINLLFGEMKLLHIKQSSLFENTYVIKRQITQLMNHQG